MNGFSGLPDRTAIKSTALFSFDPIYFIIFMTAFYLVPYPIYRWIAHKYNWEINEKTPSRHWSDLLNGLSYGLILFVFGNYTKTLNWITIVAFYPALFGYALIAELPFTKTSLPNIKNWPKGMWIVFLIALCVILLFAAYHIYLAYLLPMPFVIYYVSCLGIPLFILLSSFALSKEVNTNWCRTKFSRWRKVDDEERQQQQQQQQTEQGGSSQYGSTPLPKAEPTRNPYMRKVAIHLHHWQIFFVLAFFTRFDHPISQVAAGIVLACYMEGICAYGYDSLVNDQ